MMQPEVQQTGKAVFTFSVQGSQPDPYTVALIFEGSKLTATCTCMGAIFGNICKHRLALLTEALSSADPGADKEAVELRGLVSNSTAAPFLVDLASAEADLKRAQDRVKRAKKDLAFALGG